MDLGDLSTATDPLVLFCSRLKRLQTQSGIKQADLLGAAGLKRSQVSDILNGKIEKPPDWRVTIAIVRACLEHGKAAGCLVPPDLSDEEEWRRRYFDLQQDLDTATPAKERRQEPVGRLLAEVTDPFALEVHHPVQSDDPQHGLPALPAYVTREHDAELGRVVAEAVRGDSGLAVLVGGSSTGKTRACWEALELLREQGRPWRLWHPIDPGRPEAALRELPSVGPRTVVWLNEAQFYLGAGEMGERIAAGLREALRDPARAPVLVLATLWPQHWDALTFRPAFGEDSHPQARELLAGRGITVPATFTADQLPMLAATGDPRLALAAHGAEDRQVIQFIAGVPELMARYHNATPPAAALICAAMDARRLGMGIALPLAFLEAAAPGYMGDADWDALPEDWLKDALAYTAASGNGIRGPLTRIRPRAVAEPTVPVYRLADYLEQHGSHTRRRHFPPASFWTAAARYASPADLPAFADNAEARGLLLEAARLRKRAIELGDATEAIALIRLCNSLHPHSPDPNPAQWAATHVSLDNPAAVAKLLDTLQEAGADEQAAALLARDPGAHASVNNPSAVARLLDTLRVAGADGQADTLAHRAAAHASLDDPMAVDWLLHALQKAGADEQAAALLARDPAVHASLNDPNAVTRLLDTFQRAGAADQVATLAYRVAAHADLDRPAILTWLLLGLRKAGAGDQAVALARRAAAHVDLANPAAVAGLLGALRKAGAYAQAAALLARDPAAHASLDEPAGVLKLLDALRNAGADEQAAAFLARDPAAHASLNDTAAVAELLDTLLMSGADEQVGALLARDPAAHASLNDPAAVAILLGALLNAGADEQTAVLVHRAAAHVHLGHPGSVVHLLDALWRAGAADQAAMLAHRAAAHASVDDPAGVTRLLDALRRTGAADQAATLAHRAAARTPVNDLVGVALLVDILRKAGAHEQASTLARRAAEAPFGNPHGLTRYLEGIGADTRMRIRTRVGVGISAPLDKESAFTLLLDVLRETGADEQARMLIARLPVEGYFDLFRQQAGYQMSYLFGREPDGSPASSWGWDDLY